MSQVTYGLMSIFRVTHSFTGQTVPRCTGTRVGWLWVAVDITIALFISAANPDVVGMFHCLSYKSVFTDIYF